MGVIKFGTDGWRAIIAQDYTVDNVKRVSEASAQWMLKNDMKQVVIGYDCRFGGELFSHTAASVFGNYGIKILMSKAFVSTPMVSLAVVQTQSDLGIVITASHNPPSYNGYKLKSKFGAPSNPKEIAEVEQIIPENPLGTMPSVKELEENELVSYIDMEEMYVQHVQKNFDLDLIRNSSVSFAYDAMYGAGQNVMKRLFPEATLLHCEYNPLMDGQAPEPIRKNLLEISEVIKSNPALNLGIANDGDADRIGMFDENGKFVDSHHILLLLLYYQKEFKNLDGKVVITFSVTDKMKKLAEHYGLDIEVTKIGFKYIAEIMLNEDIIVGGEESGGLAVKGHLPERDGIWIGLMIMEFMAKTGKSINELIQDIYDKVGPFYFDRDDLHITDELKNAIISKCANDEISSIGDQKVLSVEKLDGYKFNLSDDEWIMIRPSGTEPVLRVYAQAANQQRVREILDAGHKTLQS